MPDGQRYEVIVVGGGPAGSAAAHTLASRGVHTCIIDKSDFPRDKLCGGLVTFIYSSIYKSRSSIVFTFAWVAVAALGYYKAQNFLLKLGVTGRSDALFWIVGVGVIQVSYYTSIGCCLAYKATRLTRLVAAAELKGSVYRGDGAFGLAFIGKFALTTEWMFISGWLFAPMIVILSRYNTLSDYLFIGFLGGAYLAFTILAFFAPIYIIHQKIIERKAELFEHYGTRADTVMQRLENELSNFDFKSFRLYKELLADIRAIPSWPVSLDVGVKFLISTILIPTLAAVITAALKNWG
jgi:hypothetical protein